MTTEWWHQRVQTRYHPSGRNPIRVMARLGLAIHEFAG
jgi:hypothetical protein